MDILTKTAAGLAADLFLSSKGINPARPSLSFLERLTRAFASIPYENITKIVRFHEQSEWENRLRLPQDVIKEHVDYQAGGTCFSLTFCLDKILGHLGFKTRIAMADMPSGTNLHCAVIIETDSGIHLADPGYLQPCPLPVPSQGSLTAQGGSSPIRLDRSGDVIALSTIAPGGEKQRYLLKDIPLSQEDFIGHWIRSFDYPMQNGILVTALRGSTHLYLHNNHFRATCGDHVEKDNVRQGYGERIEKAFGIQASLAEKARDILRSRGTSRIKA
ncbi:arylamine N-acetyltransferase [Acidobacteriota bacterium]